MFCSLALTFILATVAFPATDTGAPGDGLHLETTPVVRREPTMPIAPGDMPALPVPGLPGAALIGIVGAGTIALRRTTTRDNEPLFVVVHGHGGSPDDFDVLLAKMGVSQDRVVAFDYSVVDGGPDSVTSSRLVETSDAAAALDALIRSLSDTHSNIYSIHHSKGAAAGVMMIAAMDRGTTAPIDGYQGAALLDPPIARGWMGVLQRLGQRIPWIPDNGGFEAIQCDLTQCVDVRAGLGGKSGVETIVINNPDAAVTNFVDAPEDLRVYDLVQDGGSSAWDSWWNPPVFVGRAFEAHSSVLTHDAVAACISQESEEPRSCDWEGGRLPTPAWGSGGSSNLVE
ncbi:MAG: hypothetical protein ACR2N2_07940 [Acidimicrobiia bacterium]